MTRKVSITGAAGLGGTIVNFPISFEASEVFNLIEQEVASGTRFDVDITEGAKEYTARIEAELVSGKPFYLALGSVNPAWLDANPSTITVLTDIPECTVSAESESDSLTIHGAKCDRLRINFSAGEFVTYEMEMLGTIAETIAVAGDTDWSVEAMTGASVIVQLDGNALTEVQSGYVEFNNNLESRYACGQGKQPTKIREQRLEVTGGITCGQADIQYFTQGGHELTITVMGLGRGSLSIYCNSIWFNELPDEFTGHDVYEVEFTWIAMPSTAATRGIQIVDDTSIAQW